MRCQNSNFEDRLSSAGKAPLTRALYINFDLYTEGDQEYKKELASLIIANLREFQRSLPASIHENNPGLFLQACHKVKVTLSMLNDIELTEMIKELEKDIVNAEKDDHFINRSKQFVHICSLIITALTIETNHPEI